MRGTEVLVEEARAQVKALKIGLLLGLTDIRLQYRRSSLGPLWLTATVGIQVAVIGILFSRIFSEDLFTYLLYLGVGIVLWNFLVSSLNEAANSIINASQLIKQVALPITAHVYRIVVKNLFLLGHNFLIFLPLYILRGSPPSWWNLAAVIGLALITLNVGWLSVATAMVSARYRDLPAIINGALVVGFYVTPILWTEQQIADTWVSWIVLANPMNHLIVAVRNPLLGETIPILSLIFLCAMALAGWVVTLFLVRKKSRMVPFWV